MVISSIFSINCLFYKSQKAVKTWPSQFPRAYGDVLKVLC